MANQCEKIIQLQREFNELIERLEAAPPTISEIILRGRCPEAPRARILRMIANEALERTETA